MIGLAQSGDGGRDHQFVNFDLRQHPVVGIIERLEDTSQMSPCPEIARSFRDPFLKESSGHQGTIAPYG